MEARRGTGRPKRVHPSIEAAIARFHLEPPETTADPELLRRVGLLGLTAAGHGYSWKFDPGALRRFTDAGLHDELGRVQCPVGLVYGELSPLAGPGTVTYLEQTLPGARRVPSRGVANAYHHVPLDAPQDCRLAIEEVLAQLA